LTSIGLGLEPFAGTPSLERKHEWISALSSKKQNVSPLFEQPFRKFFTVSKVEF
jgi:hypothetical protein